MTVKEIIEKMKKGNEAYLSAASNSGDISPAIRKDTKENGQHPYAVVVTCSDSRVIPEDIFMAGIGELFTIRVAGNVMADHQLGSVEYAVDHLGSPLVLVLGHTNCGAVGAALEGHAPSFIKTITDEIKKAVGSEKDPYKASRLNVEHSVAVINEKLTEIRDKCEVKGAIYDIESGKVEWL
ncbi:MAG: carbonic anhydrase [Lachnospiraceae bacterium]|nr:carbonic anhydrase [Lachnospiraceae bacterium]